MPKINQEEYEILKGMNKDWKFLARDEDGRLYKYLTLPFKQSEMWSAERQTWLKMNERNFQFIQWEDEDPYNISELIEEYENSAEHVSHVVNERVKALGKARSESEETEVKKNIEWLKSAIQQNLDFYNDNDEEWQMAKVRAYAKSLDLINQLDEPEVLSSDWISKNVEYAYFDMLDGSGRLSSATAIIKPEKLKNLLVPKQEEITEEQVMEWLDNNDFYDHRTAETVLANAVDKGELSYYGTKYSVIEKPTVPQFVADWHIQNKYYLLGAKFERIADSEDKRVVDWYRQCSGRHNNKLSNAQETIALMDLVGYEVEEEQKHYALIKGHENIYSDICFWIYDTEIEELLIDNAEIYPDVTAGYMIKATKDEWANLGINDDNADFVKVEELEE